MKKKIILMLGVLFLTLALVLAYQIGQKYNRNKAIAHKRQTLPNFRFYAQNLKPFLGNQLKKDLPVCIFYYSAECEHCQYEAEQLCKNVHHFRQAQVVMVSTNTPKETAAFISDYRLTKAGFVWLYDKDYTFYKWFGQSVTPSVYIYNAEHQLVKEYTGEVKIEAILKFLEND